MGLMPMASSGAWAGVPRTRRSLHRSSSPNALLPAHPYWLPEGVAGWPLPARATQEEIHLLRFSPGRGCSWSGPRSGTMGFTSPDLLLL